MDINSTLHDTNPSSPSITNTERQSHYCQDPSKNVESILASGQEAMAQDSDSCQVSHETSQHLDTHVEDSNQSHLATRHVSESETRGLESGDGEFPSNLSEAPHSWTPEMPTLGSIGEAIHESSKEFRAELSAMKDDAERKVACLSAKAENRELTADQQALVHELLGVQTALAQQERQDSPPMSEPATTSACPMLTRGYGGTALVDHLQSSHLSPITMLSPTSAITDGSPNRVGGRSTETISPPNAFRTSATASASPNRHTSYNTAENDESGDVIHHSHTCILDPCLLQEYDGSTTVPTNQILRIVTSTPIRRQRNTRTANTDRSPVPSIAGSLASEGTFDLETLVTEAATRTGLVSPLLIASASWEALQQGLPSNQSCHSQSHDDAFSNEDFHTSWSYAPLSPTPKSGAPVSVLEFSRANTRTEVLDIFTRFT